MEAVYRSMGALPKSAWGSAFPKAAASWDKPGVLPTELRGARTHNLKGIDLRLNPGELTIVTGVSGSGKSSLVLDTLYAEGQRRFVESFSPYARQFLERLPRPPIDSLDPVAAGVAVDQNTPIKSSRSTVATMADLEPYFSGLFAKESEPTCDEHGLPGVEWTPPAILEEILRFGRGTLIVARPIRFEGGEAYLALRDELVQAGHRRIILGGKLRELSEVRPSELKDQTELVLVLDRVTRPEENSSRIAESLEIALTQSRRVQVFSAENLLEYREFQLGLACPECAKPLLPPRPGYFSYESPLGACDECRGFGRVLGVDLNKVIPDPSLTLEGGAIRPWRGNSQEWERAQLYEFAKRSGIPLDVPWQDLSASAQEVILRGTGQKKKEKRFYGVLEWFKWLETKTYKMHVRVLLSRYRSYDPCPKCDGTRLNRHARQFRLGGLDLPAWHRLEISEAHSRLEKFEPRSPHGNLLRRELLSRLLYLKRVGLGYLTLERQARTLSGGEAQRVTLTAALGTSLHNALFVLDEPTVGLHPSDALELVRLVRELASRNNSVVVIEHEPIFIRAADRIVEIGPAAGQNGGQIVFDGPPAKATARTLATGRALLSWEPRERAERKPSGHIRLTGVHHHNLTKVDVVFPLGMLTAVSGPSGSGKSSLVVDVLYRAVARLLGDLDEDPPGAFARIEGHEGVKQITLVDQSPLGRTSRGNPATYTKAWDYVRKAFAEEPASSSAGFSASTFSFNVAGGRCETCAGEGFETVEMQFLADVALECPDCGGRRFSENVLLVRHKGLNIAETLELTVDEALAHFAASIAVRKALLPLKSLGLGYLKMGQPLSTLSGGEAQRLKLARALSDPKPGTLYILDEPSRGLHVDEVKLVVDALDVLVAAGGSVVYIDHDLSLLAEADHMIELGPGGGDHGGQLVFAGSIEELRRTKTLTAEAFASRGARLEARPKKASSEGSAKRSIVVEGAREHTLKNLSLEVPHGALSVVTGPSGSGKSTLAFDVIFAEGQRRFLETLSPYARRFLPTLPRPDIDAIYGVPPSIALEQRTTRMGTRSTVATVTEVAHYLRLAFAKLGAIVCPDHGGVIERRSLDTLLEDVRKQPGQGDLWAPVVMGRKGTYLEVFEAAERANIQLAVADGKIVSTSEPPRLARTKEHTISLVLGSKVKWSDVSREQLQTALGWGKGSVILASKSEERLLSARGSCPECGFSVNEVDPRYFSFNTKQGQCEECEGTGVALEEPCEACSGSRLSPLGRTATLFGLSLPELFSRSVGEVRAWTLSQTPRAFERAIWEPISVELGRRLEFLSQVGLDYLSLSRDARSLSGGEIQRLRLAAQLGSGLTGALYVLDEPTIGLHPRDTAQLLGNLRDLVQRGSTVLVVEHDADFIRGADYLIDLGPRGGQDGGQLLASGPPKEVLQHKNSATARALAAEGIEREALDSSGEKIVLRGARLHNLKGGEAKFPIARLNVVCGLSGSGKSSLVRGVLLPAVQKALGLVTSGKPGTYERLEGISSLKRALSVDQSPIGRTPRSVPATFLGIFDEIRAIFALSPDAQVKGFSKARFSFNTPSGGRCDVCQGQGAISHEMSFLPDVITECPACLGYRFDERTLSVRYMGRSIGEVLKLTASAACEVFEAHPRIRRPLEVLNDLGAGYIQLGQGSHTLSGGEAQRLKLAAELSAGSRHEPTLYVLDEPTTGLHLADVGKLLRVLSRLVERGDTLVVIEHHPSIIANADWLVELGPEGGHAGGRIVAQGTPRDVARKGTPTAESLRGMFGKI
jgi:excinuclease ABC subunit A